MGKIRWLSGVVVCAMLASVARPAMTAPVKADAYDHTIRVACVGDSITFGSRVEDREKNCYPARLGALLGEKWEVRNFGVSGATLLKHGNKPYVKQKAYSAALAFKPDVVLIKLGTNDTKPQNWKLKDEFSADYKDLIAAFRSDNAGVKVYVCLPVPAYPGRGGIRDEIIRNEVIPLAKQVAKDAGADVIDLYSPLSGHADLFPDLVHPNARGAALIAAAVYGELTGKRQVPAAIAKITVEAGAQDRIDTPVSVELKDVKLPGGPVQLVEVKGGQRVATACQVEAGEPATLSWVLSGRTEAGTTRSFELVAGEAPAESQVKLNEDETGIDIMSHGAEVLRYHHGVMAPPPGQAKAYARSGFVHPLYAPSGAVLTAIHPKDHIHHMGIWNPWTSTEFEGRHVDFWNLKDGQGTVRFVKYLSKTAGPVFGGFRAALQHVDLKAPGGEKVALNEVFEVKVWNVGGPEKHYWIVDFKTTQRCATSSPLKLLAYRYGGFGFRATEEWNINNSDYLTSEGKTRKDGHGTRAKWCLTYGKTSKGDAGIEFMSNPANHEHPEPMRIWPDGYIFFNFCPIQKKEWTLEPGKDYTLRYRLYVYDGKLSAQEAERLWRDYGDGPVVKVVTK